MDSPSANDDDAQETREGGGASEGVPGHTGPTGPRKVVIARIFVFALFVLALVVTPAAMSHAKAAGVLLRLSDGGGDPMGLREFRVTPITRMELTIDIAGEKVRAYRYEPLTGPGTLGMVLVHGVHYRGIDETRLVRFAESIAETGITVLTPEIASLADYRIDHAAVVEIGGVASALREELGGEKPVGVMGISFAGSLALLAAADPAIGKDIGYVVTVGSYDDLGRVCRFYATGTIERPDGSIVTLHPHDYGPVVWMYSHLEDFFPAEGIEDVRVALRTWLHEQKTEARADAVRLPAVSRKRLEALFAGDIATAAPDLAADIDRHKTDLDALSPHGHLDGIKIAVFALHGSDDHLIPPSETLWLAHDLPPGMLAYALISRALTHVELGDEASLMDRLQAVHFMAGVLAESRHPG
jgi:pimeloyl-ACP methyl ester carboxylesterase